MRYVGYKPMAEMPIPENCLNCNQKDTVHITIYQKYLGVLQIPIVPLIKSTRSKCSHCKEQFEEEDMPYAYGKYIDDMKSSVKTPVWMFSGLGLIILLGGLYWYLEKKKQDNTREYIEHPKAGDIYKIKTKEGKYTIAEVDLVYHDSIMIKPSVYEANVSKGVDDIIAKGESAFVHDRLYTVAYKQIKKMYEEEMIYEVQRK
jgi:hypothetical protein